MLRKKKKATILNNLHLFSSPDLEDLVAKEKKTLDHDTDSSSSGLSGGDSSRTDILVSKCDPTDTSIPLELIKTEDGILNSDCLGHHEEGKTMMKGDWL